MCSSDLSEQYASHLTWAEQLTNQVLAHAPEAGPSTDRFRADLAGLLSTSYVASFECCIKVIFTSFAASKHKILGSVAGFHFRRINSQIGWERIADHYAAQFGDIYRKRFREFLVEEEVKIMKTKRVSLKETYVNLIKWRHTFAHEGLCLTTLEEVTEAFPIAKVVIFKLDEAMSL